MPEISLDNLAKFLIVIYSKKSYRLQNTQYYLFKLVLPKSVSKKKLVYNSMLQTKIIVS